MPGSTASASNKSGRVLLVGVNWIGDTLMAMPAVQAYRRLHPELHLTVLVKPGLAPLWRLHGAPNDVLTYVNGLRGLVRAVWQVRASHVDCAFVMPHSIRSALVPFLAGVPRRVGLSGAGRAVLLHHVVRAGSDERRQHQGFEYADLLVPELALSSLESPCLHLSASDRATAATWLDGCPRPRLAVMPGAARGPAKRWPITHFTALARRWIGEQSGSVVVLGGREDAAVCATMASELGPRALDLSGRTTLSTWAAVLQACEAVVCNDSGGMHLAAAVGTPGAAVFGLTDPARTGPLGRRMRVVQDPGEHHRDIARNSAEAQKRLAAISPERVYQALLEARQEPAAD
jgi:heptosyltransferase-2